MSIHVSAGQPEKWVPLTDEIFDDLYDQYCTWCRMAPEDRAHMVALKRYEDEVAALALTNPPEHQTWHQAIAEWHALYETLPPGGRPALSDDQKARVDAAHAKIEATYSAWEKCLPPMPVVIYPPEKFARIEQLKAALAQLKHAWENGWQKLDKWTEEERNELTWLIYCNSNLKSMFEISERNVLYFCQKYELLHQQYLAAKRESLGLNLKLRLGLNLAGKKFKRVRR